MLPNKTVLVFATSLFLAGASALPMKLEATHEIFASSQAKMLAVALKLNIIGMILLLVGFMRGGSPKAVIQMTHKNWLQLVGYMCIAVIGVNGFTNVALMILPDGLAMSVLFGCIFAICLAFNSKALEAWLALILGIVALGFVIDGSYEAAHGLEYGLGFGLCAAIIAGSTQGYLLNAKVVPPEVTDAGVLIGLCFVAGSALWLIVSAVLLNLPLAILFDPTFIAAVGVSAFLNAFCWIVITYHREKMTSVQRTSCTGFEAVGGASVQSIAGRFEIGLLIGVLVLFAALSSKEIVVWLRRYIRKFT